MDDLKFFFSRFMRRFPFFLIVATLVTAVSVTVALTLPPAYESEVRMLVESQQIPGDMAESTVATPAPELLQIIEQRLMTRENLLSIARELRVFPDQDMMNPDEIVQAMRAHTRIRSQSGRGQATLMTITFEAYQAAKAAGVLNAYLSLILKEEAEFRTGRAESTLDFFEQQVATLAEDLDQKNREVLEFKNANAGALPETLNFQMAERADMQERLARVDSAISTLHNQRDQLKLIYEATGQVRNPADARTPRQQRLFALQTQLDEALGVYSEQSPRVRQLRSQIEQAQAAVDSETAATLGTPEGADTEDGEPIDATLKIQLADIDSQVASLEKQRADMEKHLESLSDLIARTPANGVVLEGLTRDRDNLQGQYNQAVNSLARANTGERIEVLSRGQRITVVEPPAVPTEPTKPDRMKLAVAGTLLGIASGIGLVVLLEFLSRTPKRPEDIVARFEVMPIASIPYVRSRRQLIMERVVKLSLVVVILIGVPVAIYAVHQYYLPLDLIADKVMNKIGVRL